MNAFLRISFHQVDGHDLCKVWVKPSPKPVWIETKDDRGQKTEQLFIRTNNSSRPLNNREAVEYAAHRWPQPMARSGRETDFVFHDDIKGRRRRGEDKASRE